jgi:hypothetical protein
MKRVYVEEPVRGSDRDLLRIKTAAWDDDAVALAYCWPTKNGTVAHGCELPLEVLRQAIELAVRHGFLTPGDVLRAVADALER